MRTQWWVLRRNYLTLYRTTNFPLVIVSSAQLWWYMPIIPALGRLRQEDHKGYIVIPCLKKMRKKKSVFNLHSIYLGQYKNSPVENCLLQWIRLPLCRSAANFTVIFFFFFWDSISLCTPHWPQIHDPPATASQCWDCKYVPACLLSSSCFCFFFLICWSFCLPFVPFPFLPGDLKHFLSKDF
jgi:hypothetical protein